MTPCHILFLFFFPVPNHIPDLFCLYSSMRSVLLKILCIFSFNNLVQHSYCYDVIMALVLLLENLMEFHALSACGLVIPSTC